MRHANNAPIKKLDVEDFILLRFCPFLVSNWNQARFAWGPPVAFCLAASNVSFLPHAEVQSYFGSQLISICMRRKLDWYLVREIITRSLISMGAWSSHSYKVWLGFAFQADTWWMTCPTDQKADESQNSIRILSKTGIWDLTWFPPVLRELLCNVCVWAESMVSDPKIDGWMDDPLDGCPLQMCNESD